jgi:hypothetical protein
MPQSKIKKLITDVAKAQPPVKSNLGSELETRLNDAEYLLEQLGQTKLLTETASEYFRQSTIELVHLKYYRLAATIGAALMLVFLLGLLVCVIFFHQIWFFLQGQVTRSAVIIGTLTGSIILMTVILKSVFKSASDRSKEDMLPPHLKDALEIVRQVLPLTKG